MERRGRPQASAARLGPDEWLDAALEAFERGGVDAVRIERLAAVLRVTRGSFYWHFSDRDALLRGLLARWEARETLRIIEGVEAGGGPPAERLMRLLETCARDEGRLEMALRSWAGFDAEAKLAIAAVDRRRTDYLARLLAEHGLEPDEAGRRARVAYAAWLGEYTQPLVPDAEERIGNMRCLHRMLLRSDWVSTSCEAPARW